MLIRFIIAGNLEKYSTSKVNEWWWKKGNRKLLGASSTKRNFCGTKLANKM
jgi:hypothetical protein